MKPAAPKVAGCKDLAASRLAAANPCYAAGSPDVQQPRARGGSKQKWPRDFVRPRPAIRREALPIAEGKTICTARLRPVQDVSSSRGDGQPSRHSAGYVCETGRPRWKKPILTDTPALGFAACCLGCHAPISRPSFRYAPASGSRGILSSRWRDDARARVQTPRQNIVSFAATLSCRNASGTLHNTYCA